MRSISSYFTPPAKKQKTEEGEERASLGESGVASPSPAGARKTLSFSRPSSQESRTTPRATPKATPKAASSSAEKEAGLSEWLKHPKDAQRRDPSDPDYDPKTLYVPYEALKSFTPAQAQYWEIKKNNFDVVLFFKMGKFYELFDVDAAIGHKELDLMYMSGSRLHVGFPEVSFDKYAEQLVQLGYKVGRVEQVETPAELKKRNERTPGKNDKCVRRAMLSLLTKGTLVEPSIIGNDDANYLVSLCEADEHGTYGVCYVDTSTGSFTMGEFTDDPSRTTLRTLFAQLHPQELLFPKHRISEKTQSIIKAELKDTLVNALEYEREFYDAARSRNEILVSEYWSKDEVPCVLTDASDLTISSFGGCLYYLRRLMLDRELMSISSFQKMDQAAEKVNCMVLDGHTLSNLEILENQDGGKRGSLLSYIDHCSTPFGRRLLRHWVSHPLFLVDDINDRLNALDDLNRDIHILGSIRQQLQQVPDLERLLSRVHAYGLGLDKEAVMYENVNLKKLRVFLSVLEGYELCSRVVADIAASPLASSFTSKHLKRITALGDGFPDLSADIEFYNQAFDHKEALGSGFIVPFEGVDDAYDGVCSQISMIEAELQTILKETQTEFSDSSIKFVHVNKEPYQLEIAERTLERLPQVPETLQHISRRKGYQRFWTDAIRKLVQQLEEVNAAKDDILRDITRKMFAQFCTKYAQWRKAANAIAELDCLISLAVVSSFGDGDMCRPIFTTEVPSFLEIRQGRHPCVSTMGTGKAFIPNDTVMGCKDNEARFLLVTGGNMSGKSTLLRQTCLIVILAQLGCYVPAASCSLSPVDRVFTRIGAHDRILAGQSTFLVELEETATILSHSTKESLVILDELGRGTSTFDGTAIAFAVSRFLADEVQCRALFSTHYHMLTDDLKDNPRIENFNMACTPSEDGTTVTFLYTFSRGVCPKSFGMNVARMAGLPEPLVQRAQHLSDAFTKIHATVQ